MKVSNLSLLFFILFSCFAIPTSFAGTPPREINAEEKDTPTGRITLEVAGVCGQDYWLVSPINADFWEITIYMRARARPEACQ